MDKRRVTFADQRGRPSEIRPCLEAGGLALQALIAVNRPADRHAALAQESVGRGPVAVQRFLPRQVAAGGIGVEVLDDGAQLLQGTAEALAILLGEFRRLRRDSAADDAGRDNERACDHDHLILPRPHISTAL